MPAEPSCGNSCCWGGGEGSGIGAGDQSPHSEVAPPEVIGRKSAFTVPESQFRGNKNSTKIFFAFLLTRNFHQCGHRGHTKFELALSVISVTFQ